MRVLIFGAGGILGHRVWLHARDRFDAYAVLHSQLAAMPGGELFDAARTFDHLDLTDDAALDEAFRWAWPDVVVNAAGLVKQRPGSQDPLAAIALNDPLPHRLAARCQAAGARLIQVSTDCVFPGQRGAYCEADVPDPPDVYGRSNLLGEVDCPGMPTLRASIIGREQAGRQGLLDWFPSLGVDVGIDPVDGPAIDRTLDDARLRQATAMPKPTWAAMLDAIAADAVPYDQIRGEHR
ncbi:MAG: sugar nucleotide-binding protein [Thermomicrobiales bacterium]